MTSRAEAVQSRRRGRRAFTLIELMVVIAVIGLLIAAMALVGRKVIEGQKRAYTETILRGTTAAIDQFRLTNPLAGRYDRKTQSSFGPYPPYELDPSEVAGKIAFSGDRLSTRLHDDLSINGSVGSVRVNIADGTPNDDIRALYTYLAVYVPDVLQQIPDDAIKPLPGAENLAQGEYVQQGSGDPVQVFGIYDAWGVPLDYMLYVKLEYKVDKYGQAGWRVTDRTPALRSLGVQKEVADAGDVPAADWIFSEPLPEPVCRAVDQETGSISGSNTTYNGWVRARAEGDKYPYHGKVD